MKQLRDDQCEEQNVIAYVRIPGFGFMDRVVAYENSDKRVMVITAE